MRTVHGVRAKQQVGKRQREERLDLADGIGVNFRSGCGSGECNGGFAHAFGRSRDARLWQDNGRAKGGTLSHAVKRSGGEI